MFVITVVFRKELQRGSTIITLPAYRTHLSGKVITCELIRLPAILRLREREQKDIIITHETSHVYKIMMKIMKSKLRVNRRTGEF